jgi:hypothetical protein
MAKKQGYGEKAVKIMELLNTTSKSDHQIAYAVGCHVTYVKALRRKMAHKVEEPKVKEAFPDFVTMLTQSKGKESNVDAILDERGSRYGNFLDHARITQRLKNVAHQFATDHDKRFDVDQAEALDMIFHKIGRILNGDPNYADSWIDIAGYAKLVADRLQGNVR